MPDLSSVTIRLHPDHAPLALALRAVDVLPESSEWDEFFASASNVDVGVFQDCGDYAFFKATLDNEIGGGDPLVSLWRDAGIPSQCDCARNYEWPEMRLCSDGYDFHIAAYENGYPVRLGESYVADPSDLAEAVRAAKIWAKSGRIVSGDFTPRPGSMLEAWFEFLASKAQATTAATSDNEDIPLPYDIP